MGIVSWAVWGLFVGAVARLLLPGRTDVGIGLTVVFGVAGSILGGLFATRVLGAGGGPGDFGLVGFMAAVAGSVVLIGLFGLLNRPRPEPGPESRR